MRLLKLVLYASLFGFIVSISIHIYALLGRDWLPGGLAWALSIGVFLTNVPAFHSTGLDDKSVSIKEHGSRLSKVLADCPPVLRYGTILIFLYGIAIIIDGMDVSFGENGRTLNTIRHIRSISVVWASFYAIAGTLSYSIIRGGSRAGRPDGKN